VAWRSWGSLVLAAGLTAEGRSLCYLVPCAARELLRIRPDFAESCRTELKKWWDSELTEHLIDSLR
jgi:hypothetical protein